MTTKQIQTESALRTSGATVEASGRRRTSSDPYPVGGESDPAERTLKVYGTGELNMTLSQHLGDIDDDDGTSLDITWGFDGTLRVTGNLADGTEIRRHVKVSEIVFEMINAELT